MQLGICVRDIAARDVADLGRLAEDHGYAEIWVPDGARGAQVDESGRLIGRDAFIDLAVMFESTTTLRGGLGVAAVPMHQPMTLALLAATLTELSEGRFSLGVGVSHPELTARHGIEFPTSPIGYMRDWLRELRARSESGLSFGGGWPVLLAALGPKMVELGATEADGLVLNWLTPEHAAHTVATVRAAATGRAAPRTVLYLRLMPAAASLVDAANYDALGNYHRHFRAQGLDGVDSIVTGTTLPIEDIGAARARIDEYRETGLDLLCIYPHALDPVDRDVALIALTA